MRSKKLTHVIFKTVRSLGRSPEDVVDFKNYLNSLDFFATFCIKAKSREEKYWNTHILFAKHNMLALSKSRTFLKPLSPQRNFTQSAPSNPSRNTSSWC
jgi:hypothetical protein